MIPYDLPDRTPRPRVGVFGLPATDPAARVGVPRIVPPPPVPAPRPLPLAAPVSADHPQAFNPSSPVQPPHPFAAPDGDQPETFADRVHRVKVEHARDALLNHMHGEMEAATRANDYQRMVHVAGQYSALNNGGFSRLAQYHQEQADAKAQREHLANQDNPLASLSPDDLWMQTVAKHGDVGLADAMAQRRRISLADAAAKASGKPAQFQPGDAQAVLASRYPDAASVFEVDDEGQPKLGSLSEIHAALVKKGVSGLDDPRSEVNQVLRDRVKRLYGDGLADQLAAPIDNWAVSFLPGMGTLTAWVANQFGDGSVRFAPHANAPQQLAANQWWKAINQPPAP